MALKMNDVLEEDNANMRCEVKHKCKRRKAAYWVWKSGDNVVVSTMTFQKPNSQAVAACEADAKYLWENPKKFSAGR